MIGKGVRDAVWVKVIKEARVYPTREGALDAIDDVWEQIHDGVTELVRNQVYGQVLHEIMKSHDESD